MNAPKILSPLASRKPGRAIHAGLALAAATGVLAVLSAPADMAPSVLLLGAPLVLLAAHFWALPGLAAVWAMGILLGLFKIAQLQDQPGFSKPAIVLEMLVLTGSAALAWYFKNRSNRIDLMHIDGADNADRESREILQSIEAEKAAAIQARQRADRLEATRSLTEGLGEDREFWARADKVCRGMVDLVHGGEACLMVAEGHNLHMARKFTPEGQREAVGGGTELDRWVCAKHMGLLVSDIEKDIRFKGFGQPGLRSIASVPVVKHDQVKAVLRLSWDRVSAYNHEDLRLLTMLADVLAASDNLPEGHWTGRVKEGL